MGQIQDTEQQIATAKSQLQQARQQAEQFQPQVQLSARQLHSQTPTSMVKVQELQRQRGIAKEQALTQVQSNEQQVQEYEKQFQDYLRTPSGILSYAQEKGIKGTPLYDRIVKGGAIELVGYKYDTPYGTVEDKSIGAELARQQAKSELKALGYKNYGEFEKAQVIFGKNIPINPTSQFAQNLKSQGFDIKGLTLNTQTGQLAVPQLNEAITNLQTLNAQEVSTPISLSLTKGTGAPTKTDMSEFMSRPSLTIEKGLFGGQTVSVNPPSTAIISSKQFGDMNLIDTAKFVAGGQKEFSLTPSGETISGNLNLQLYQPTLMESMRAVSTPIAGVPAYLGGKAAELTTSVLRGLGMKETTTTTNVMAPAYYGPGRVTMVTPPSIDISTGKITPGTSQSPYYKPPREITITDTYSPESIGKTVGGAVELGTYLIPGVGEAALAGSFVKGSATALDNKLPMNERIAGAAEAVLSGSIPITSEVWKIFKAGRLGISYSEIQKAEELLKSGKVGLTDANGIMNKETNEYNNIRFKVLQSLDKKYGMLGAGETTEQRITRLFPPSRNYVEVPTQNVLVYDTKAGIRAPLNVNLAKVEISPSTKFIADVNLRGIGQLESLGIGERIRNIQTVGAGENLLIGKRGMQEFEKLAGYAKEQGLIMQDIPKVVSEATKSKSLSYFELPSLKSKILTPESGEYTSFRISVPTRTGITTQNIVEYSEKAGKKTARIQYVSTTSPFTKRQTDITGIIGLGGKRNVETSLIFGRARGRPLVSKTPIEGQGPIVSKFTPEWQLKAIQQTKTKFLSQREVSPGVIERVYKNVAYKPFAQPVGKRVSAYEFLQTTRAQALRGILPGTKIGKGEYVTELIKIGNPQYRARGNILTTSAPVKFPKNAVGFEYVSPGQYKAVGSFKIYKPFITSAKTEPNAITRFKPEEQPFTSFAPSPGGRKSSPEYLKSLYQKTEVVPVKVNPIVPPKAPTVKSVLKPSSETSKATQSIWYGKGMYEKMEGLGFLRGEVKTTTGIFGGIEAMKLTSYGPQIVTVQPQMKLENINNVKVDVTQIQIPTQLQNLETIQILNLNQRQQNIQQNKEIVREQIREQIKEQQAIKELQQMKVETKQVARTQTITTPKEITKIQPPRPPQIKLPFLPYNKPKTNLFARAKPARPFAKYTPEIRRFRKFQALGAFETPEIALAVAKRAARGTLGASIRVRTPKGFLPVAAGEEFRLARKAPNVLVQRKTARISSIGEKKEIQMFRKAKTPNIKSLKVFKYSKGGLF